MICGQFPKDFMWGTATAAYQIEGAADEDGKSPSVWDTFARSEGKIRDNTTGDVACDSYNKFAEDVKMIKMIKNTHYRFSFSWSRLLPTGDPRNWSEAGVKYYNKVINELLENGIQPMVTLYHWDLPQCLQDTAGWQNDDIIEKFKLYADFCFKTFGDRVKIWITINEPHIYAALGFGAGTHAPGIKDPCHACYTVSRTLLLAHAVAWRLYDETYRPFQNGKISIALNSDWSQPKDPTKKEDRDAAEVYLECTLGWFAHPVFVDGDYPGLLKERVLRKSREEGLEQSRLPTLTQDEKKLIKGTYDFFGINHYTTRVCEPMCEETMHHTIHPDLEVFVHSDPSWEKSGSHWLFVTPWGFRKLLNYITKAYGNPEIIVTENGCSTSHPVDKPGDTIQLEDEQRCRYLTSYINEALKAYLLDGVKLRGYFVWSLMDNFEWACGYTERFGLFHVDFNDPLRKRTPRKSARIYAEIAEDNGFKEVPPIQMQ